MKAKGFRIKSSIVAGVAGTGFLAAAAVSGQLAAGDPQDRKGDRFAVVGEELCAGQAWPNVSAECVAWRSGAPGGERGTRYVTVEVTDEAEGFTELRRIPVEETE